MLKRLCAVAVTVIVLFCVAVGAQAKKSEYPDPEGRFFVNDFANVISQEDSAKMVALGQQLDTKTTAQVVAVTVETTSGKEISEYALELGRQWGVGQKDKDNGVVILLSVKDRNVYVAVGYGLEGALPDSKTGRLIDRYAFDYFKVNAFSQGVYALYNAIVNEIYIEYGITPDEGYTPDSEMQDEYSVSAKDSIISWVWLIILVILYIFLFRRRMFIFFGGPFGPGSFGGFSGRGSGGGSFGGGGAGKGF